MPKAHDFNAVLAYLRSHAPQPGFFSTLDELIASAPREAMTPEEWRQWLQAGRMFQREGVQFPLKKAELEDTGVLGMVNEIEETHGNKPIERDYLRSLVEENRPKFLLNELYGEEYTGTPAWLRFGDTDLIGDAAQEFINDRITSGPTRFQGYRLHHESPGSEYLESVTRKEGLTGTRQHFTPDTLSHSRATIHTIPREIERVEGGDFSSYTKRPVEKIRLVEEIQSDYHHDAHTDGGYFDLDEYERLRTQLREIRTQQSELSAQGRFGPEYDQLGREGDEIYHDILDLTNLPSKQPFADPREYARVELSKQLLDAVRNDEDYLALTTGQDQIDRYQSAMSDQRRKGMRDMYDKAYLSVMKKLANRYGAQMTTVELPVGQKLDFRVDTIADFDAENWDDFSTMMADSFGDDPGSVGNPVDLMFNVLREWEDKIDELLGNPDPDTSTTLREAQTSLELLRDKIDDMWSRAEQTVPFDSTDRESQAAEAMGRIINEEASNSRSNFAELWARADRSMGLIEEAVEQLIGSSGADKKKFPALKLTPEVREKILKVGVPLYSATGALILGDEEEDAPTFSKGGSVSDSLGRLREAVAGFSKGGKIVDMFEWLKSHTPKPEEGDLGPDFYEWLEKFAQEVKAKEEARRQAKAAATFKYKPGDRVMGSKYRHEILDQTVDDQGNPAYYVRNLDDPDGMEYVIPEEAIKALFGLKPTFAGGGKARSLKRLLDYTSSPLWKKAPAIHEAAELSIQQGDLEQALAFLKQLQEMLGMPDDAFERVMSRSTTAKSKGGKVRSLSDLAKEMGENTEALRRMRFDMWEKYPEIREKELKILEEMFGGDNVHLLRPKTRKAEGGKVEKERPKLQFLRDVFASLAGAVPVLGQDPEFRENTAETLMHVPSGFASQVLGSTRDGKLSLPVLPPDPRGLAGLQFVPESERDQILQAYRGAMEDVVAPGMVDETLALPVLGELVGLPVPEISREADARSMAHRERVRDALGLEEPHGVAQNFADAAGVMLGQLPVPEAWLGRLRKPASKLERLKRAVKSVPGAGIEFLSPIIDPKLGNYIAGTLFGGTLGTILDAPEDVPPDIEELIKRAKEGDEEAYNTLLELYNEYKSREEEEPYRRLGQIAAAGFAKGGDVKRGLERLKALTRRDFLKGLGAVAATGAAAGKVATHSDDVDTALRKLEETVMAAPKKPVRDLAVSFRKADLTDKERKSIEYWLKRVIGDYTGWLDQALADGRAGSDELEDALELAEDIFMARPNEILDEKKVDFLRGMLKNHPSSPVDPGFLDEAEVSSLLRELSAPREYREIVEREFRRELGLDSDTPVHSFFDADEERIIVELPDRTYVMELGSDDDAFYFVNPKDDKDVIEMDFPEDWIEAEERGFVGDLEGFAGGGKVRGFKELLGRFKELIESYSGRQVEELDYIQDPNLPHYYAVRAKFRRRPVEEVEADLQRAYEELGINLGSPKEDYFWAAIDGMFEQPEKQARLEDLGAEMTDVTEGEEFHDLVIDLSADDVIGGIEEVEFDDWPPSVSGSHDYLKDEDDYTLHSKGGKVKDAVNKGRRNFLKGLGAAGVAGIAGGKAALRSDDLDQIKAALDEIPAPQTVMPGVKELIQTRPTAIFRMSDVPAPLRPKLREIFEDALQDADDNVGMGIYDDSEVYSWGQLAEQLNDEDLSDLALNHEEMHHLESMLDTFSDEVPEADELLGLLRNAPGLELNDFFKAFKNSSFDRPTAIREYLSRHGISEPDFEFSMYGDDVDDEELKFLIDVFGGEENIPSELFSSDWDT